MKCPYQSFMASDFQLKTIITMRFNWLVEAIKERNSGTHVDPLKNEKFQKESLCLQ